MINRLRHTAGGSRWAEWSTTFFRFVAELDWPWSATKPKESRVSGTGQNRSIFLADDATFPRAGDRPGEGPFCRALSSASRPSPTASDKSRHQSFRRRLTGRSLSARPMRTVNCDRSRDSSLGCAGAASETAASIVRRYDRRLGRRTKRSVRDRPLIEGSIDYEGAISNSRRLH